MSRVRGWCPTAYEPMESGDGLLIRVKPRLSRLSIEAVRLVADVSERFGNGVIELTNRGNLQLRGLRAETAEPCRMALLSAELVSASPGLERVRNITVSPLAGVDPGVAAATEAVAEALETALAQTPDLHALAGKFGFVVDGGGALALDTPWADIRLQAEGDEWLVILHGGGRVARVDAERATLAAVAVAKLTVEAGGVRVRDALYRPHAAAVRAQAEAANARQPRQNPVPGPLTYGLDGRTALLATPKFGQMTSSEFAAAAEAAEQAGCRDIRMAPDHTLIVPSINEATRVATKTALAGANLAVDPGPRVVACPGAPACASGHKPARADAARLAASPRLPRTARIHVSGCAKGCAHPGVCAFTLVGTRDGYDLIVNGAASGIPSRRRLDFDSALNAIGS